MNQTHHANNKTLPKFYQPFILHYQCIGSLNTSTTLNHCRGIQSKIELLQQLPISNYTNAIHAFHHWNTVRDVYYHPNLGKGRVLGIEETDLGFGGPNKDNNATNNKIIDLREKKNSLVIMDKSFPNIHELFPTTVNENFDCIQHYGISNIYVLIMREIPIVQYNTNMNQAIVKVNNIIFDQSVSKNKMKKMDRLRYQVMGGKVVAVAPNMINGVTIRGITCDKDKDLAFPELTTINLGPMEITIASVSENGNRDENDSGKENKYQEVIKSTTKKGIEHCQFTGRMIYNTVQDDFYNRMKNGGVKVMNNFDKTWNNIKKLVDKFW